MLVKTFTDAHVHKLAFNFTLETNLPPKYIMQFLPANLYTHFHQPLLFIHKDPASYKNSRSLKGNASHTNTHCMPDNTQHVHKSRTAVARHTVLSSLFSFSNMEFKDLQPLGLTGHAGLSLRL